MGLAWDQARHGAALAGVLCALLSGSAAAQGAGDFYKGRTVTLVIGSGEGAAYDINGRLVAQYLRRYLPGNPTIVPQNMPGASSVRAMEHLYNVAARDGTVLGFLQPSVILNKLLDASARYEPEKITWIGRLQPIILSGVVSRTAPAQTIAEARQQTLIMGAATAAGTAAMVPWALNRLIGTKFTVVRGYESETAEELAMQRGEIQGIGSALPADSVAPLMTYLYTIALGRDRKRPDIPTIVELVDKPVDRDVLSLLASVSTIGETLIAPPGVPPDRVAALRDAFAAMVGDRPFIDAARAQGIDLDMLSGVDVQKIVLGDFSVPQSTVERLKAVTAPQ